MSTSGNTQTQMDTLRPHELDSGGDRLHGSSRLSWPAMVAIGSGRSRTVRRMLDHCSTSCHSDRIPHCRDKLLSSSCHTRQVEHRLSLSRLSTCMIPRRAENAIQGAVNIIFDEADDEVWRSGLCSICCGRSAVDSVILSILDAHSLNRS